MEGDAPLVIDLGTGLRALGEYLQPRQSQFADQEPTGPLRANALLSHLHYDHVLGLPFFTPMRDPGAVFDIYGPTQQDGPLGEVLASLVKPPFFPIHMAEFRGELRFHDLSGAEELVIGTARVTVRSIPHIGHTLGFRIEADGVTVVYMSDHQAPLDRRTVDDRVLELCRGADLLIHDGQYTDAEFATLSDFGHSTAAYAVHVAERAGVHRLSLFHHDPAHTDDDIDLILAHALRCVPVSSGLEVTAASEGSSIELVKTPS